jgi:hypothetical protein
MSADNRFVLWFVQVFLTDKMPDAAEAVCGGPKDKGIDAIYASDAPRVVYIVQGKYRKGAGTRESRNDVLNLIDVAQVVLSADNECFQSLIKGADALVAEKLRLARHKLRNERHSLQLCYVSLGTCSANLRKEAERRVRSIDGDVSIVVVDGHYALELHRNYLDGNAPPMPTMDLEMESGRAVHVNGVMQRYDRKVDIESWVFPMQGDAIAKLYEIGDVRLFARNIRGFLGQNTAVNAGMASTLEKEPERFFYYNNGITIVCEEAVKRSSKGKDVLRVRNPQIINGQQTTRALAEYSDRSANASVLVKVIKVPRSAHDGEDEFDALVSNIVAGTNWQNSITASDLRSNDRRQIEIERALKGYGYLYLRKRMTIAEARRSAHGRNYKPVKKDELAQAVAGCDLDPVVVRSGKEKLFEEELYDTVFPNADPLYYLPRYSLMKEVSSHAWGYPERGYAKWLVLGFVWSNVHPLMRSRRIKEDFHDALRYDADMTRPLSRAIDKVYAAAIKFYRAGRGRGRTAIDVSQFFRNKRGRDEEFRAFWSRYSATTRKGFTRDIQQVENLLKERDA